MRPPRPPLPRGTTSGADSQFPLGIARGAPRDATASKLRASTNAAGTEKRFQPSETVTAGNGCASQPAAHPMAESPAVTGATEGPSQLCRLVRSQRARGDPFGDSTRLTRGALVLSVCISRPTQDS